jgi:hypothetical protein
LIAVFLLAILLPVAFMNHNSEKILETENRVVMKFSDIFGKDDDDVWGVGARERTESFLNDNIGFKEFSATATQASIFELFHYLSDSHLLQGEDGNLFYSTGSKDTPNSLPPYAPVGQDELEKSIQNLSAFNDYFESQGIPLLFCTIPDKENVYPELYPNTFFEKPVISRLAMISDYVNKNTNIDALDLTAPLIEAKGDEMLYYASFDPSHWNWKGAFVGYREIMNRLAEYQEGLVILGEEDLNIKTEKTEKTLPGSDFILSGYPDTLYTYSLKKAAGKLVDVYGIYGNDTKSDDAPLSHEKLADIGYDGICQYYENDNIADGKKLLIIGDSYINTFFLPYFIESYAEVYYIKPPSDSSIIKTMSEAFGPDVVLYELVERTYSWGFDNLVAFNMLGESDE